MDRRTKEAVRYLGYGRCEVDKKTMDIIGDCFEEIEKIAGKRLDYRIFNLRIQENSCIINDYMQVESESLSKNLEGCDRVIMLGATLGIETDLLMKRYAYTDMARVIVLQACAAALLEEYIDQWQEEMAQKMEKQSLFLRERFSPGYGDFSIKHQKDILRMLDTAKKIGLTMTDGSMLTPTKSVTALIGLSKEKKSCGKAKCKTCSQKDCPYRE